MLKFIFVMGGVISGVGKGTFSAALARVLKECGYKVLPIKFDGYLNVDAGTLNPYEHGEVFVLKDGLECDMDLGTYERFLNEDLDRYSSITGGMIFREIIEKERRGDFLGRTVEIFPHASYVFVEFLERAIKEKNPEILLVEIGGTVGDPENEYAIKAIKIVERKYGKDNVVTIYIPYLIYPQSLKELKTKPFKQNILLLWKLGIFPDIIVVRCPIPTNERVKEKVIKYVYGQSDVFILEDLPNKYLVPLEIKRRGIIDSVLNKLRINMRQEPKLTIFESLKNKLNKFDEKIKIAIAGKYTDNKDAYVSIEEALYHAAFHNNVDLEVVYIETTNYDEKDIDPKMLEDIDGILVPGGFGKRGTEGKVKFIQYARENKIPFLGICFGAQLAVVEFARNVCNLENANSTEIDPNTPYPVIDILPWQKEMNKLGGTMRLGEKPIYIIKKDSLAWEIYRKDVVYERHRHRYEINPDFLDTLTRKGLIISGVSENNIPEIIEMKDHPFFFGIQAHPEFKSRLENPSPPYYYFVKKCIEYKRNSKR